VNKRHAKTRARSNLNVSPIQSQNRNIRLINGQWKGRKLPVLEVEDCVQRQYRVKETLFNC
jgi:hypothetical protein